MSKIADKPGKTFAEGYIDGFQSVRGSGQSPPIPGHALPAGYTPYQWGYEQGRKEGEK